MVPIFFGPYQNLQHLNFSRCLFSGTVSPSRLKVSKDSKFQFPTKKQSLDYVLEISLDYLTGLDYSLFINDPEMTRLLKNYETLKDEDKSMIKKMLKAFSFYSRMEETQAGLG